MNVGDVNGLAMIGRKIREEVRPAKEGKGNLGKAGERCLSLEDPRTELRSGGGGKPGA